MCVCVCCVYMCVCVVCICVCVCVLCVCVCVCVVCICVCVCVMCVCVCVSACVRINNLPFPFFQAQRHSNLELAQDVKELLDSSNKPDPEVCAQDLIDFSPVYRCLHIHSVLVGGYSHRTRTYTKHGLERRDYDHVTKGCSHMGYSFIRKYGHMTKKIVM